MKILDVAKKIIKQEMEEVGLKVDKIILFGSRARVDYTEDSDWDLLVLINKELSPIEKRKLRTKLSIKLFQAGIDCEIILKSKESYQIDKNIANTISYSAYLEGVEI